MTTGLVATSVAAALSACTASDVSIGMGVDGPIPPAPIGSAGQYAAPAASATRLGNAAPMSAGTGPSEATAAPTPQVARATLPPAGGQTPVNRTLTWQSGPAPIDGQPRYEQSATVATNTATNTATTTATSASITGGLLPPPSPAPATAQPDMPEPAATRVAAATPAPALSQPAANTAQVTPSASVEVQFLPLVGAPKDKADILAHALSEAARAQNVTIRPAADGTSPIRLKGYFSAFEDGGKTVVVYVWDVLGADDQRYHRIQGQESAGAGGDDPWSTVDKAVFDRVAAATLTEARKIASSGG